MIDAVKEFLGNLKWEDVVDFARTIVEERYELLIVIGAILFIFVLCLWTMLERLEEKGFVALLPVYRFSVLFSKLELKPLLSLLMLIPGINIIMRIIFYVKVAEKFNRSYFLVPFLCLLPLPFLPIVAFGDGKCPHVKAIKQSKERKRSQKRTSATKKGSKETSAADTTYEDSNNISSYDLVKEIMAEEQEAEEQFERTAALSMAELKTNRMAKKLVRKTPQRGIDSIRRSPNQKRPISKPQTPTKPQSGRIVSDVRPSPKNPSSRTLKLESEYDRLLRAQQQAAKKPVARPTNKRPHARTIDMVTRPKKQNPTAKPPKKNKEAGRIKIT